MSKYTTGEIAKLCNVSVRTVQYYDSRSILVPSELTEGGRRLYSEDDLRRMKIICFLRDIGLPINSIGELLKEDDPGSVIAVLLDRHEATLREELNDRQEKLDKLDELRHEMKAINNFSVESIGDIAHKMENRKKLKKVYFMLLVMGIPLGIIEWGSLAFSIATGIWWPFIMSMAVVIIFGIMISVYYFSRISYICPQCHKVFRPNFKEAFFARHTPTLRKLTCGGCGYKGFCVEIYRKENSNG